MSKLKYWEFNLDKFSHWVIIVSQSKEWALETYLECCGVALDENVYPKELTEAETIDHYGWHCCIFPEWEDEHDEMLKKFYKYSRIEGFVLIC